MTTRTGALNPEETLARSRAEEAAARTRLQTAPGVASLAQVAGRSGLQIFQALLAGEIPPPPMAVTLDFTLLRIEPGFAVVQGQPRFSHYNPMGTVHGGWFATMLDTAMGCTVHSTLSAGKAYTTLELKPVRESSFEERSGASNTRFYKLMPKMAAAAVARAGYEGMKRGSITVIPGLGTKITAFAGELPPRRIALEVNRWLLALHS